MRNARRLKTICLTVTNELVYDQRMIRICTSLQRAGYDVLLTGRSSGDSPTLSERPFRQKRLRCYFPRGPMFYAEFNFRLFVFLLFTHADAFCAIDLDSALAVWLASVLRRKPRFLDAHELFCEMKEVRTRPRIHRIWKRIEKWIMPRFPHGYTVCDPIASIFKAEYGVDYAVIRNVPTRKPILEHVGPRDFLIYQGAVNEGRSFETLIPAMREVDLPLHIYGDGNFMDQARKLVADQGLADKVRFMGKRRPEELARITPMARAGITLFENNGLSNYLSLGNRFFDYIQAGIPQLCVDYPSYRQLDELYHLALRVSDLSPANLAKALNNLCRDEVLYQELEAGSRWAALELNWEAEEKILLAFYAQHLH